MGHSLLTMPLWWRTSWFYPSHSFCYSIELLTVMNQRLWFRIDKFRRMYRVHRRFQTISVWNEGIRLVSSRSIYRFSRKDMLFSFFPDLDRRHSLVFFILLLSTLHSNYTLFPPLLFLIANIMMKCKAAPARDMHNIKIKLRADIVKPSSLYPIS